MPEPTDSPAPDSAPVPDQAALAKLRELIDVLDPPPPSTHRFGPDPAALLAVPIEQVIQSVLVDKLQRDLDQRRETDPGFEPTDWLVVCPPYLFANVTQVLGLAVRHSALCPPWTLLLIRSPESLARDLRSSGVPLTLQGLRDFKDNLPKGYIEP